MKELKELPAGWWWATFGDVCKLDRQIVQPESEQALLLPYIALLSELWNRHGRTTPALCATPHLSKEGKFHNLHRSAISAWSILNRKRAGYLRTLLKEWKMKVEVQLFYLISGIFYMVN